MKLISQESDPWSHAYANGWFATREHRLHLVELASEFDFNRFLPYIGTINAVEFGGVPAGHLAFSLEASREGVECETWKIVATLRESSEHGNKPLPMLNTKTGEKFTLDMPRYTERDFHDVLPRPEPFPDTSMTLGAAVVYYHQELPCIT